MYQAGTLSGNPVGMAAGLATLQYLADHPETYDDLERRCAELQKKVDAHIGEKGYPVTTNRVGSMFTVFFTDQKVESWEQSSQSDTEAFGRFFQEMLAREVHLPPAQFEAWFMSIAVSDEMFEDLATKVCESLDAALT